MQAVIYDGPGAASLRAVPVPQTGGLLLAVEACGICGTDLTIWKGGHPRAKAPLILGHEFVARVAEPGQRLAQGARVTCFPLISCGNCETCLAGQPHVCEMLRLHGIDGPGGMAEFVRIPESDLIALPEDLPTTVAAQAEPLAVCVHAARRAGITGGEDVAIIGAGPIGVTLALCLRGLGTRHVQLFDTNAERVAMLTAHGFDAALAGPDAYAHALARIGRSGFDTVFECAGAAQAATDGLEMVRVGGRLVIVSIHARPVPFDLQRIAFREVEVIGTRVYTRQDFDDACAMLPGLAAELAWLAGPLHPLDHAPALFEALTQGHGPLKAVLAVADTTT